MTERVCSEDVQRVIDGELRLLQPEVRSSAAELMRMLSPDFCEFGASGNRWNRAAIVEALVESEEPDTIVASEIVGTQLSDRVVLVTYVSEETGRRVRRSSIWRRNQHGAWRMYFHQGTPLPSPAS